MKVFYYILGLASGILLTYIAITDHSAVEYEADLSSDIDPDIQIQNLKKRNRELSRQLNFSRTENRAFIQSTEVFQYVLDLFGTSNGDRDWAQAQAKLYASLFDLDSHQLQQVEQYFLEQAEYYISVRKGLIDKKLNPPPKTKELIKQILDDTQRKEYEAYIKHKNDNRANLDASFSLYYSYPFQAKLSEKQNNALYENLYTLHHEDTELSKENRKTNIKELASTYPSISKIDLGWTGEIVVLAADGVLSEEQMTALLKHMKDNE